MKRFPFSRLKLKEGWISSSLIYNPHCNLPPTVIHEISIEIDPLELGADAAMPEYQQVVNSSIVFDGLIFERRSWNALGGSYTFGDDQNGSFYVSSAHNPVTVRQLTLQHRGGATYDADSVATFHFEYEDSGYADETTRLLFSAKYGGFRFCVPQWSTPDKIAFPSEWNIPSASRDWPESAIRDFAARYCDLSQFAKITIENGILSARPTAA